MQKKALHDGCILGGERFAIVAGTLPNATDTGVPIRRRAPHTQRRKSPQAAAVRPVRSVGERERPGVGLGTSSCPSPSPKSGTAVVELRPWTLALPLLIRADLLHLIRGGASAVAGHR
jgi:hypothetical protein